MCLQELRTDDCVKSISKLWTQLLKKVYYVYVNYTYLVILKKENIEKYCH